MYFAEASSYVLYLNMMDRKKQCMLRSSLLLGCTCLLQGPGWEKIKRKLHAFRFDGGSFF